MHWKLTLHDVHVEPPDDISKSEKAIATPVAALVNAAGKDLPLEFELKYDAGQFHWAASAETVGLWKAVGGAVAEQLADRAGLKPEEVKGVAGKAWDALKGLRKGKVEDGEK